MDKVNVVVIGAGVVGLSIAAKLAEIADSVYVIEKHHSFGQETSSRNSEVIHAGIYYPKGSLKADLCAEGKHILYQLCSKYRIPFSKSGKLIVALDKSEEEELDNLLNKAKDNGVGELELVSRDRIRKLEPNVKAVSALYSKSTGIVDSHSLMKYFVQCILTNNAEIVYNAEVKSLERTNSGYIIGVEDSDGEHFSFESSIVVNSAGLNSDTIAQIAGLDVARLGYGLKYCRGQYFRIAGKKSELVNGLVYPVPGAKSAGLGIHATPDLQGSLRLGPDDEYIEREKVNLDVNLSDRKKFYDSTVAFLPFLEPENLVPDTVGIRPKLQAKSEDFRDFVIKEESENGLPGFINLIGIESPGLTAAPAIAQYIAKMINL